MTHVGRFRTNNEDAFLALNFDAHEIRYLGKTGGGSPLEDLEGEGSPCHEQHHPAQQNGQHDHDQEHLYPRRHRPLSSTAQRSIILTLRKTGVTFNRISFPPDDPGFPSGLEVAGLTAQLATKSNSRGGTVLTLPRRPAFRSFALTTRSTVTLLIATVLSLAAAGALACGGGGDAGTGPSDDIYVTYDLESIDGDPVPSVLFQGHDEQVDEDFLHEIVTGYIRLDRDNTIKTVLVQRVSFGDFGATTSIPPEGEANMGSFTRNGNTLVLTRGDGTVSNLTLSDNGRAITEVKTLPTGLPGEATDVQFAFIYAR